MKQAPVNKKKESLESFKEGEIDFSKTYRPKVHN